MELCTYMYEDEFNACFGNDLRIAGAVNFMTQRFTAIGEIFDLMPAQTVKDKTPFYRLWIPKNDTVESEFIVLNPINYDVFSIDADLVGLISTYAGLNFLKERGEMLWPNVFTKIEKTLVLNFELDYPQHKMSYKDLAAMITL